MREFLDEIIRDRLGQDPASWALTQGVYLVAMMAAGIALTTFGALFAGLTSWWERRIAARMQSRVGPNRVGPQGILQFLADALKLLVKEDLISSASDRWLFRAAPYFVVAGFALTFVVLPFGYHLSATRMNVGLFYVLSVTALVVVGILISGWASNSKWALFGGIRAAAQVVSYEIPAGLVILVPVLMAGSLNLHDIIRAQGGWPWDWYLFQTPMGYAGFFILFVALLAEGNRTPFDLPEAESELVSGYNTEYSGMRFAYFFLTEFGNLWVMSAVMTTCFLGGWQVPGVSAENLARWEALHQVPGWFYLVSAAVFCAKTLLLANVVIWIRWTFPRVRVDQMMSLCWKYLVPAAMALVVLAAVTELMSFELFGEAARVQAPLFSLRGLIHFAFFAAGGLVPAVLFFRKTFRNISFVGDRVRPLSNW
ncbi:MAG: NADH-quinone oxidoreductase subunit NuoH [Myxococcales bacterium]|nr:NADH-quinone oxidoreductase subunit NuoH [Myxococcales bacterium]